jgi:Reprolysin (M12B) family zinc metalloprotease
MWRWVCGGHAKESNVPALRFDRFLRTVAVMVLASLPHLADAAVTVLIDGAAYPAQLRENTGLLERLHVRRSANVRHVDGELQGVPGSWIRASLIDQRWQGVVALDGKHFVIDSPNEPTRAGGLWLDAQSPDALAAEASCASEAPATSFKSATVTSFATAEANFALLCQTTVDGTCLLAKLEIAFDRLFLERFPNTYPDQAAALLNIVDGHYANDLNTQFDAITMEFMTTDLFDPTTNSSDLLTDIGNKKNNGQIPFVKNRRAIFHLVTGRDFDTSTVGIASVGTLCSASDNTGTSQYYSSIGMTALIVTHEMAHNFGAEHDGDPGNTCGSGFIMAATLSPSASHFSSCSIDEITAGINGVSNQNFSTCFEYPVDAALAARPGNPTSAGANQNFTLSYDLSEIHASVASSGLRVTGSLSGTAGTFAGATVNGIACTVSADGASFNCSTGAGGGLLEVTARTNGSGTINVLATVSVPTTGSVKDIDPANDSVSAAVVAGTPPAAPSGLMAVADAGAAARIDLTWRDNSNNEDGFRIERQAGAGAFQQIASTGSNVVSYSDNSGLVSGIRYTYRLAAFGAGGSSTAVTSGGTQLVVAAAPAGGGGGGGSFGVELVPLLALAALRRRRPGC